jgi:hypothetical protein
MASALWGRRDQAGESVRRGAAPVDRQAAVLIIIRQKFLNVVGARLVLEHDELVAVDEGQPPAARRGRIKELLRNGEPAARRPARKAQ